MLRHRRRSTAVLAALGLAVVGCDTPEDRPSAWSYVHAAIVRPSCTTAACHSKLGSQAGLDLSTADAAYAVLTGRVCGAPEIPGSPAGNLVLPGHPESSRLMYLLRGEGGAIMPPDVPLPDAEIAIVERWILEGATCD